MKQKEVFVSINQHIPINFYSATETNLYWKMCIAA